MRLRAAFATSVLLACALPVAGQAAQAYLTVSAPATARARITLPNGVRLAWSKAALTGGGTYRAAVLDRAVYERSAGTATSSLAVSALAAAPVRSARADASPYPGGAYDVYLAGDGAVTLKVPVTGMPSRSYRAALALRATRTAADVRPSSGLLGPYAAVAGAAVKPAGAFGFAFARWDLATAPGPYDTSADLCFAADDCQGAPRQASGLSTDLPGAAAVELGAWATAGALSASTTKALTHYDGSWRPDRARVLTLTIPVAAPPTPPARVAIVMIGADQRPRIVTGRFGEAFKAVYTGPHPAATQCPSVSPDGRWIAFADGSAGLPRPAVIRSDGTGHRRLSNVDSDPCDFVWSKDSTRLYYGDRAGNGTATYTVPIDGSAPPRRVPDTLGAQPASLRGSVLALSESRGGRFLATALIGVDGSGRRRLGDDNLAKPIWSPDGRWLAVFRVLRTAHEGSTIQVWVLDARTGRAHALAATQSPSSLGLAYPLAWTSDSRHLYYVHYDERNGLSANARLFRIRPDGGGKADVTPRWGGGFPNGLSVQQQ